MGSLSRRAAARLAAWCTVGLVALGPVSLVVVPSMTTVPGDVAATAALLAEHATLARVGMLGELGIVAIELVMTVALLALFRDTHREGALLVAGSRLAMTVLQAVTAVAGFAAVAWLSSQEPGGHLAGGAALLDLRQSGTGAWQMVFGMHCVVLGAMIGRSGLVPRWLGGLMAAAGGAYLVMGGAPLLLGQMPAGLDAVLGLVATVGEVPFYLYLLFRPLRARP
ncbi:MAG: DUF4386 domain-containing protein [Myxococcales bacterium]|nr:DUF4386 domain-containing protein [Myxococcales bacterium]